MEYADPQLISNFLVVSLTVMPLSSWTRALTCSTSSAICEVVRQPEEASSAMVILPLQNLSTFALYSFLHIVLTFCISWRVLLPLVAKIKWQHVAQQLCNPEVELACLHYDCISFTEHGSYITTCTDLAQYVIHVHKSAVWQITRILHSKTYSCSSTMNHCEWIMFVLCDSLKWMSAILLYRETLMYIWKGEYFWILNFLLYCKFLITAAISDIYNKEPFDICKTSLNKACFRANITILILKDLPNIAPFGVPNIILRMILLHILLIIWFLFPYFYGGSSKKVLGQRLWWKK